jgi:hypothetical protein
VATILLLCTLLVLAAVFTIAGFRKNQQIQELRTQAVSIDVIVTSCVGLLGGSGSNFVGYSCTGSYTVGGQRYRELLPGAAPLAQGSIVHAVVVPSDPALISTAAVVSSEHTSWKVFILPAVVFLAALLVAVGFVVMVRSRRTATTGAHP